MPANLGNLPVYMRVGDGQEFEIGTIAVTAEGGALAGSRIQLAAAFRAFADQVDPPKEDS